MVAHGQANNGNVRVLQEVELPAGAASVQATIRLPQHDSIQFLWWNVHIDGVFAAELSIDKQTPVSIANTVGTGNFDHARLLVIAPDAAPGNLAALMGQAWNQFRNLPPPARIGPGSSPLLPPAASFLGANGQSIDLRSEPQVIALTIDSLPRHVLDYTAFDAIVATHGQLQTVADGSPRAMTAIRDWVGTGGTVWVHGLLDSSDALNGVEALFDLGPEPSDIGNPEKRGWQPMRMTRSRGYDPMRPLILTTDPNQHGIFYRQRDLGSIVISRYNFDESSRLIQLRDLDPATSALVWGTRHGVVPSAPSPSFPTLLIPDVGLAPIGEFQFLITLFVILIGPFCTGCCDDRDVCI